MKQTIIIVTIAASVLAFAGMARAGEEAAGHIQLPPPARTGGMPLADALSARRSSRAFADVELAPQELSDLLWATAGVNRSDGRFTYPVARGRKDMTLFVVTKAGAFRYDPADHALDPVIVGDRRADTGTQSFVAQAAVNLVFVQDLALWDDSGQSHREGEVWGYAHAGSMTQSAHLHAAARDWGAVVRGLFDGGKLKTLLKLAPRQRVTLTMSVGPQK